MLESGGGVPSSGGLPLLLGSPPTAAVQEDSSLLRTQCRHGVSTQCTLITALLEAVQCHAFYTLKKMIKTLNKGPLKALAQHHPN